jgi:hypothetical protein
VGDALHFVLPDRCARDMNTQLACSMFSWMSLLGARWVRNETHWHKPTDVPSHHNAIRQKLATPLPVIFAID